MQEKTMVATKTVFNMAVARNSNGLSRSRSRCVRQEKIPKELLEIARGVVFFTIVKAGFMFTGR